MFKIMLADDEGIVIDSLTFIIRKEFGDECEIASAKTGRGVIELAESFRPDIAFMDIQMPGINGIEAIRQIKERNPHIIFIIMTAYDRFNYAKEAVNLGVFEYLNKPVDRHEIVDVLNSAMNRIRKERDLRSKELIIREKLETVVPVIENGFIYAILFQENYSEDAANFKRMLDISEDYGCISVLVCGDDQQGSHMTNAVGSSIRISRIYGKLREVLKENFHCFVGSAMGNKIVLFLPYSKPDMDYSDRISLIERARDMIRGLKREHEASFRMGFGLVCGIEELPTSYNKALEALTYTDTSVAHADDLPVRVSYEENYPMEVEKALFASINRKELDVAVSKASTFFDWMITSYPDDMDNIRLKILEFVLRAESIMYGQGAGVYRFSSRSNYLSEVLKMSDPLDLKNWFTDKIREACHNSSILKEESSDSIIDRAKLYIENNYRERDVSLDDVSREVDISPYYFSKLFKEETGENFIEYITRIRIEKAKELLMETSYSMKEICAQVGYSDPNYFSRSFKKNVGVTPTEYKEQQTGQHMWKG